MPSWMITLVKWFIYWIIFCFAVRIVVFIVVFVKALILQRSAQKQGYVQERRGDSPKVRYRNVIDV